VEFSEKSSDFIWWQIYFDFDFETDAGKTIKENRENSLRKCFNTYDSCVDNSGNVDTSKFEKVK
jgi:hypothetical protein